ncbi:type II TA system antitoxin MqsA family protein [Pseudomonas syringae group genomosp. 3]|uniref:type II TA system antitoxin MqsA family protein n=1 Tax=Pseudomonas syringae group genomosp. 3 TaxID=251701 RepID=UPI000F0090C8|nr:type II TA system antitoxin MqsA family protein [Pseudomonas syringae group genomosp. 3]
MNKDMCHCCGASSMHPFKDRSYEIGRGSLKRDLQGLSGYECRECGEVEFDAESATRYSNASDELVLDKQKAVGAYLKQVRSRLKITQKVAVEKISGGGHNAFSRYEKAEVTPAKSLVLIMYLLDKHPELLDDINQFSVEDLVSSVKVCA